MQVEQRIAVGADGGEGGVAEVEHPGESDDDVQSEAEEDGDQR